MKRYSLSQQLDHYYDAFPQQERPVIGITANYGDQTAKLADGYYKQVIRAGGTPLILPPESSPEVLSATLDRIDALLLTGGADINPLFQGEQPLPQLGGINAERDLPELLITRLAYNRQLPILGICRGIQTMAMALGGKVTQDIGNRPAKPTDENGTFCTAPIKHSQEADRHVATHTVCLKHGSTLYNIYKDIVSEDNIDKDINCESEAPRPTSVSLLPVNSFHHQAVAEPGPHFCVTATAPDGIIEAIESTEFKPMLGVQWHPECMGDDGLPLFQWLVGEARLYRKVQRLHDSLLTLDTHCDTPMFFPQNINFTTRDSRILVDLPKMTEGRLDATIMVAYIPQPMQESAFVYANSIFDRIVAIADGEERLALARTPDEIAKNKATGRKSIVLGIENGKALEGYIGHVGHFAKRGVVYITLCHNGDNDVCDSAKGSQTHGGVSPFGREVIAEMNRWGLMVDLSHAHERSFYDALDLSSTPIVCSHSSCRALCDHPRNLTDDQMRALAAKGGVCQITLYPGFLRTEGQATILDAMEHLDHAIRILGIEHVGLGTDFDGDGGVCGLADASEMTLFTRQLLLRRYTKSDIEAIWGGNFLRVMALCQQSRTAK